MKNNRIFIIYSVMILIGLTLICYSSTKKNASPPKDLIIQDYGFTAVPMEGGTAQVSFALEVENPNTDFAACNHGVRLIWEDAAGHLILSRDEILPVVLPEQTIGFATNTSFSALPHKVSVELITNDGIFISMEKIELKKSLCLSPPRLMINEDTLAISGEIINPSALPLHQGIVTAVMKNGDGKITGGISFMVKQIAAQESTPYTIPLNSFPLEAPWQQMNMSISLWFQDLPYSD